MIKIKQQDDGSYQFDVQTDDGQVLMTSCALTTADEAENLAKRLKSSNNEILVFERKTNHRGEFLFNVKDADGQLLGTSQRYNSEAGMENGINNLKIRLAAL